jgi:hypothetical protein
MITTVAYTDDFVVAEQHRKVRSWTPHIFRDKDQFAEWYEEHPFPKPIIVDRRTARGRMYPTEDHRNEYFYFF